MSDENERKESSSIEGADIASIIANVRDIGGMLRRALESLIQLYTDKSHFVYELLQNAEDTCARRIKFIEKDDKLIVLHDGSAFTIDQLRRLCDIGISDKIYDYNQIGQFGVGFKSVFAICKTVQVISRPKEETEDSPAFAVEIHDFIRPENMNEKATPIVPRPYTTMFVLPYCVGESYSGYNAITALRNGIAARLTALGSMTLLFMQNLKAIEYEIDTEDKHSEGKYELRKEKVPRSKSILVSTNESSSENSPAEQYLLYSKQIPWLPDIKKTVDIAFPFEDDPNNPTKKLFKKARSPAISVYFPTETESKLSFVIQGPFRTTPNRSSIPFDDEENVRLAELAADLLRESILDLLKQELIDLNLLRLLPLSIPDRVDNWLFQEMYERTYALFAEEKILPTIDGGYTGKATAYIARGQGLVKLFDGTLLSELLHKSAAQSKICKWLPTELSETNSAYRELFSYLTTIQKIQVIRADQLSYLLENNVRFFNARDNLWLKKYYEFLGGDEASQKDRERSLTTVPFIKTQKGKFRCPYKLDETSTQRRMQLVYMPGNEMVDGFDYVDSELAVDCYDFFIDTVKLKEPDVYAYFKKQLEKNYPKDEDIDIQREPDEHIDDIKKIFHYLNTEHKHDIEGTIKKHFRLLCTDINKEHVYYINPFSHNVLSITNDDGISYEELFRDVDIDNEDLFFIYEEHYAKKNISLSDLDYFSIKRSVIIGKKDFELEEWFPWNGKTLCHCEGDFDPFINILGFNAILIYIINNHNSLTLAKEKSKIILKLLMSITQHLRGYLLKGKVEKKRIQLDAFIVNLLRETKWLFDSSGELQLARDLSPRDLDKKVYGDIDYSSEIFKILEMKPDTLTSLIDDMNESEMLSAMVALLEQLGVPRGSINDVLRLVNQRGSELAVAGGEGDFISPDNYPETEFPARPIRDIERLRNKVKKDYDEAMPVTYEMQEQSVRTSIDQIGNRVYLTEMYHDIDSPEYSVCQMCGTAYRQQKLIAAEMELKPKKELPQTNILLCGLCHPVYRELRYQADVIGQFKDEILSVREYEDEPVVIPFADHEISFTATHIAELQELIRLDMGDESTDDKETNVESEFDDNVEDINSIDFDDDENEPEENDVKGHDEYNLLDEILLAGIEYEDNRNRDGGLWIIGGQELQDFVKVAGRHGYHFAYKPDRRRGRPGWWLT